MSADFKARMCFIPVSTLRVQVGHVGIHLGMSVILDASEFLLTGFLRCSWVGSLLFCIAAVYVLQMVFSWAVNVGGFAACEPAIDKSWRFLPLSRYSRKGQKTFYIEVNKWQMYKQCKLKEN